jgi:class 3 adenylate cyclase
VTEQQLERRIVTVLFADLVGFTSLSERLDAEDVAAIQDAYFAAVRETVGRYSGRLEKFIGDAAVAAFGAERARDDDAERAVRAGLALVHAVQQLAAQLDLHDEILQLRVGINTGEVVVATAGPDEGRLTGDTVNTAARLQAAAPPMSVLIGAQTGLLVAESVEMEQVQPLELKGKAHPTAAHRVTGLRPEPSREQAMGQLQAPMLGREAELEQLRASMRRGQTGDPERWLIVAPPGVGKSRLLRELAETVRHDPHQSRVLRTRARPEATSALEPVAGLFWNAFGLAELERALVELERALAGAGHSSRRTMVVVDAVSELLSPSAAPSRGQSRLEDRDALFAAWLDAFDALALGSSEAWLVEDVHWAAGDVLAFLAAAGSRARGGAVRGRLVVVTARPSLLDSEPEWCSSDPAGGRHVLQLATLSGGDARALIDALVGDALPDPLRDRVVERSDGNCLFIEELLRTWVSTGTLVRHDDGWQLAVRAEDVPLPASVQSIYGAQLDDLPPAARLLARRASVAGRRFPGAALAPLGIESGGRAQGLDVLTRRALIEGPAVEPPWNDVFSYRHALLRDAGYSSLARAERGRLHVRLARWLAESAGDSPDQVAASIAGHYAAALDSAPALAREVGDGLDRDAVRGLAAEWYERAGRAELGLFAHQAARSLLLRSIDLTARDASLALGQRWEALADATAHAADMDEGAAAYERAIDQYRAAMATDRGQAAQEGLARAVASICDVWYEQIKFDAARDLADRVLDELERPDPTSLARLLTARALAQLGAAGEQPGLVEDLQRAVELARSVGDEQTELRAVSARTLVEHESGRGDPDDWRRMHDIAVQVGAWHAAVTALSNQAIGLLDERAEEVHALTEQARELALAYGRTEDVGWSDYLEAEAGFVSGDWDRAVEAGERAVQTGQANNYRRLVVRTLHVLIPIAEVRADRPTLELASAFYATLQGPLPDSPYARLMRPAQDLPLADAGLIEPFALEVEPRLASFERDLGGPSWTAAADRVFRHWIETGKLDAAARIIEVMSTAVSDATRTTLLGVGTSDLLRGRLELARGDHAAAADAASSALVAFRACRAPWWMAKAMRLLQRAGGADPELLAEVAQIERDLGALAPTA